MDMTISFIIPVYNCKAYLESCAGSVCAVAQFWEAPLKGELILVDDGSTDGSGELCDRLSAQLSSQTFAVRVIHQANRGVSAARNAGLQAAFGSYVQFVDADDKIDPEKLGCLLQMLAADPAIDMAVFGIAFDYYHNAQRYRSDILLPALEGVADFDTCDRNLYKLFSSNALSALWNKVIRREMLLSEGVFLREDMFLYEDLEFSLRALAKCESVYFCQEAIYRYRQSEDEGNAGRRLSRIAHIPRLLDKIQEALAPFGEQKQQLLLALHLVLAREKIGVSQRSDIKTVCEDFKVWIDSQGMQDRIANDAYAQRLYRGKVLQIRMKRAYSKTRHRLANWVKRNFGDFRK